MKEKRKRKGKIERQAEGVDDRKAKSEREREREVHSTVTRFGKLPPIGRLFSLDSFFENHRRSPHYWATFSRGKNCALN
jgi:hypothetical protein